MQFVRDNPELVKEKSAQKGYTVDIDRLLELDKKRRELVGIIEEKRAHRNELSSAAKGSRPTPQQIEQGKKLKDDIAKFEVDLQPVEAELVLLHKNVPNMPLDGVPIGASEDENVEIKVVGEVPQFDFQPKSHAELGELNGWIDKERAAKVAGARFAYLKGDLVKLQWALMQFGIDVLTDEDTLKKIAEDAGIRGVSTKPFVPVLPPLMIQTELYDAMDRLQPSDDRYKIEGEELWLQGSAEHVLGSMHANEIFDEAELPIRYVGYATSFRREAGTYGKDTEGIIRMHQFDKLEMESFTTKENSLKEHLFMVAIQEYLVAQLGLPYHVLEKCTADIGKPNAKGVDIEVWMASQGKYRETHTADYMTDYQARRLKTRVRRASGDIELVHTNDATAFAQRPLIAILENNQTLEGKVVVPEVLQKYLGGKQELGQI